MMKQMNEIAQRPKFGMPMDQFKSLLKKDERVPKMLDKRKLVEALQAKLEFANSGDHNKDQFQALVFRQALDEALTEQARLNRVRIPKKDGSPSRQGGGAQMYG